MERGDEEQDQLGLRHLGHQGGKGDGGSVERAEDEFDSCGSRASPRKCESQVVPLVSDADILCSLCIKYKYLRLFI